MPQSVPADEKPRPVDIDLLGTLDRQEKSGYNLARMPYAIILAPEATKDLKELPADVRAIVREGMEIHLRHEPQRVSKSRIKRLRGLSKPQYRLRVGDVRVFYDISGRSVEVLAIVFKPIADSG
jgi:mRNA-degrading endonuclease RelE of RelBE toxin-antitoxin system